MEAKKVQLQCQHCNEPLEFDLNEADYSSEITINNGKKSEKRIFTKSCDQCNEVNEYISSDKTEWGNRQNTHMKTFMFTGGFSCLVTIVIIALVGFFAIKGITTIFEWISN